MNDATPFKVVIPTRNSARWIVPIHDAYCRVGIDPLYIVDARSDDETAPLLRRAGASLAFFEPPENFIEAGSLAFAAEHVDREWLLRLDDDEFPSPGLLKWATDTACRGRVDCWGVPRHNAFHRDGEIRYGKSSSVLLKAEKRQVINPQFRLYRKSNLNYIQKIHTPGFYVSDFHYAPPDAYIAHFDTLLRPMTERLDKVRRYETTRPGFGWTYGAQYLPELFCNEELATEPFDSAMFAELIRALPIAPEQEKIELRCADLRRLHAGALRRENHERRVAFQFRQDRASKIVRSLPSFVANKSLAEFVCTLAEAVRPVGLHKPLFDLGSALFEKAATLER